MLPRDLQMLSSAACVTMVIVPSAMCYVCLPYYQQAHTHRHKGTQWQTGEADFDGQTAEWQSGRQVSAGGLQDAVRASQKLVIQPRPEPWSLICFKDIVPRNVFSHGNLVRSLKNINKNLLMFYVEVRRIKRSGGCYGVIIKEMLEMFLFDWCLRW